MESIACSVVQKLETAGEVDTRPSGVVVIVQRNARRECGQKRFDDLMTGGGGHSPHAANISGSALYWSLAGPMT